jgi:hypothetical protein
MALDDTSIGTLQVNESTIVETNHTEVNLLKKWHEN